MAGIKLKNVTKRWGNFIGVKNFDLEIADRDRSGTASTTRSAISAGRLCTTSVATSSGTRLSTAANGHRLVS
mgnify:CR=1 FL=1